MLAGVPIAFSLDEQRRWESISSLVNVFSPLALMSAATVGISGLFASWVHLERLPALWQTLYGRTLLIKLALVGVTLLLGAYNFRRVQPRLAGETGVARLRRSATLELSVALLVLVVTGYLTGVEP
jgi:putative copper export protein